jgi:hypothetical protein
MVQTPFLVALLLLVAVVVVEVVIQVQAHLEMA